MHRDAAPVDPPLLLHDLIGGLGRGKLDLEVLFTITQKIDRISGRFRRIPKVESPFQAVPAQEAGDAQESGTLLPASFGDVEEEVEAGETGCRLYGLSAHGIIEDTRGAGPAAGLSGRSSARPT